MDDDVAASRADGPAARGGEPAPVDLDALERGGDAACWLAQLCADCGAMVEGPEGTPCWRCGSTRREGDD